MVISAALRVWRASWHSVVLLSAVCATSASARQIGVDLKAFTGTWTENATKSSPTISKDLTYTFREDADGFIDIARGGVQLRDRVRFDGQEYPTPNIPGRTTSWKRANETVYDTTIKNNGKLTATARWTLSADGARLRQETTRSEPGAALNTIEYIRSSGSGATLIGVWEPVSSSTSVPESFVVTLVDEATLRVFFPRSGLSYDMRPDGKEYAARSDALPDMKAVVTGSGPRTLKRNTFRGGAPMLEAVWTLSPDGRTLTLTSRSVGGADKPSVFVYDRIR